MHHANAAQTGLMAVPDELAQSFARLIGAQAMQVDLALDAPVSLAQFSHDIVAQSRTPEAQVLVGVQQGLHVEFVRQGLLHHGLLVALALHRSGRDGGRAVVYPPLVGQRPHRADCQLKQAALALLPLGTLALGRRLCSGGLGTGAQFAPQLTQIGQRLNFHARHCPAACKTVRRDWLAQTRPISAMEAASVRVTMKWSNTRTSTSDRAALSDWVRVSSAREGRAVPLGWL